MDERGCPECDYNGKVAVTSDYTHTYYAHIIVRDGEIFEGTTCSERYRQRKEQLARILGWIARGF